VCNEKCREEKPVSLRSTFQAGPHTITGELQGWGLGLALRVEMVDNHTRSGRIISVMELGTEPLAVQEHYQTTYLITGVDLVIKVSK
jgi:hypothetical protein